MKPSLIRSKLCPSPAIVATIFAALLAALTAGCGSAAPPANPFVPVAELSPEVVKAAQKALPNVKFENARKIQVGGEDAYEIRGKQANGKIREVEVSAAGKVLEIE